MKATKSNYWAYNKELQPFANKLRHNMTKAEACLWKYVLRASMMRGYPFRRQRPVLNYIADFMSKDLNLIIEVDGVSHTIDGAAKRDVIRQKKLEEAGFKVIRFTDDEVWVNMKCVVEKIENAIFEIEQTFERKGFLPLHPLRGGGHSSNGTSLDKSFLFLELMVAFTWVPVVWDVPRRASRSSGLQMMKYWST